MSNLDNKNKNLLVENIIVFFLFTVYLVFKSLKTLSKVFTYGIIKIINIFITYLIFIFISTPKLLLVVNISFFMIP